MINWKVRVKNPWFWVGLIAMLFCAMGVDANTFTTWSAVSEQFMKLISNPFMIGSVIVALITYVNDPTTATLADSEAAMNYSCPKKED